MLNENPVTVEAVMAARLPQNWEYVSHRRVLQRASSGRFLQRSPTTFLWSSPRTGTQERVKIGSRGLHVATSVVGK